MAHGKKDRFSVHIHNGGSKEHEAVTILRHGGTVSQSGLVGITNLTHSASDPPILPETILNVQSAGESNIRLASSGLNRSNIELLGNGNSKASGLHISYNPANDDTSYSNPYGDVNTGAVDKSVVDFSLIRPSGEVGREIGFLSVTEDGFLGLGSTKDNDYRIFTPVSPLTVFHNDSASGTIALKAQTLKPSTSSSFGKIYVKPQVEASQTHGLFFLDGGGNEFNLTPRPELDSQNGLLYGDQYGNTYGGWLSPQSSARVALSTRSNNTLLGYAAGYSLSDSAVGNAILGYLSGSGVGSNDYNTILGTLNYTHNYGNGNIIVGFRNSSPADLSTVSTESQSNSILIGTGLYNSDDAEDYTFAVGFGSDPLVEGSLGGTDGKRFALKSTSSSPAEFSLDSSEYQFSLSNKVEYSREVGVINLKDTLSSLQSRGVMSLRFSNKFDASQTLVDFDPSGTLNVSPIFTSANPRVPFVAISGDLRVAGKIRFADGTSLGGASAIQFGSDSGVASTVVGDKTIFTLDFTDLQLASSATPSVTSADSYIAIQVPSGSSDVISKMSIQSLSNYVGSGFASVANNCNYLFSNAEADVSTTLNSGSIFIGCDVAPGATGWKHSIMLGTQAGAYATTPNVSLATDTACTFIGYQAGYDSDNIDNSIFLGTSAGKNADSSSDSIFIGSNAGLNSSNANCIGIGEHALRGEISAAEGGSKNIEIVTGLLDNQRLMYASGNLSSRLNIQNTIAGRTDAKMVSIGDAVLTPDAPLSVRKDNTNVNHSNTNMVQTWHDDDSRLAHINGSGDFVSIVDGSASEAWFGHHEGFMDEYIYAPSSYTSPTSGLMTIKNGSFASAEKIWVTNRDVTVNIHGPGAVGGTAFVITARINGENRPIYVSCSGSS
tara:strand:+ start:2978 stop:5647 length:2670 start_codon:yes stop_codon:yes gene_type:complete